MKIERAASFEIALYRIREVFCPGLLRNPSHLHAEENREGVLPFLKALAAISIGELVLQR